MSDGAKATPPQPEPLEQLYLRRLQKFDGKAVQRKQWYFFVWAVGTLLTWFTLLLAIAGTALPQWTVAAGLTYRAGESRFEQVVLHRTIPLFGILVTLATIVQTVFGLQGRWLKYRAAAERLREAAMLYRARLAPFDGADADAVLRQKIEDIARIADTGKGESFVDRFDWKYYGQLLRMPEGLKRAFPHTPDQSLGPRLGDDPTQDETFILDGRLRNQRRWHLLKAQTFAWRFVYLQAAIVIVTLFNTIYAYRAGRAFWVIALTTAGSLMLLALRDFLDYGPLFQRYVKIAGNLREIEEAYLNRRPPFHEGESPVRLQRLADYVEQTLSSEFQYWYGSRHGG